MNRKQGPTPLIIVQIQDDVVFFVLFRRDRDRSGKGGSRDISPNSKAYNRGISNPRRSLSRTPSPSRIRSPRYSSRRERSPRGRSSPPREYREKRYCFTKMTL